MKTYRWVIAAALLPTLISSLSFGVAYAADAPAASDDTQSVAIVTTPLPSEEQPATHLSLAGLGSLYWAARQPAQAWRVLLPMQPDGAAYADIRARCTVSTDASRGEAACP
jgi:hypothetical protein